MKDLSDMTDAADFGDSNGMRARHTMGGGAAMSPDFGVKKIDCCQGASMGPPSAKMMSDDDRGAGMPVKHTKGRMPSQAMPDHGDHGMMGSGMSQAKMPMGGMSKRSGEGL